MSRHRRSQPDGYDENFAADLSGATPSLAGRAAGLPGDPASPRFPPDDWALLTHLPAQVVIAAISIQPDAAGRTVVEGLAGIEAIAGGRAFDSDLVRAVVAAIFAEPDEPYADAGSDAGDPQAGGQRAGGPVAGGSVAHRFVDRGESVVDLLVSCRAATAVLAQADPADSAAYRQWLQSIAARVCEAARSGNAPGAGGWRYSAADRRLLADLGAALSLT
jgi:hypothetical protein